MKQALEILEKELIAKIIDDDPLKNNIEEWFQYLYGTSRIDDARFMFCIAIDLKFDLVDITDLINIFKDLNYTIPKEEIRVEFDRLLHYEGSKYFRHSKCLDCNYTIDKYISVRPWIKLFDKIKLYKTATGKFTIMDFEDEDHIRYRLFTEYSLDLQDVKEWAGWKNLTWLIPKNEFEEIRRKHSDDMESLNYVMDSLGLEPPIKNTYSGEFDFYVFIEYPDDFDLVSYQPSSLCGYWKEDGGLYLSFKKLDGYGRTFATSGGLNQAKERVINSLEYGNEKFKPNILGKSDGTLIKNRTTILQEALKRLTHA